MLVIFDFSLGGQKYIFSDVAWGCVVILTIGLENREQAEFCLKNLATEVSYEKFFDGFYRLEDVLENGEYCMIDTVLVRKNYDVVVIQDLVEKEEERGIIAELKEFKEVSLKELFDRLRAEVRVSFDLENKYGFRERREFVDVLKKVCLVVGLYVGILLGIGFMNYFKVMMLEKEIRKIEVLLDQKKRERAVLRERFYVFLERIDVGKLSNFLERVVNIPYLPQNVKGEIDRKEFKVSGEVGKDVLRRVEEDCRGRCVINFKGTEGRYEVIYSERW